jgi:hypothetical protein
MQSDSILFSQSVETDLLTKGSVYRSLKIKYDLDIIIILYHLYVGYLQLYTRNKPCL